MALNAHRAYSVTKLKIVAHVDINFIPDVVDYYLHFKYAKKTQRPDHLRGEVSLISHRQYNPSTFLTRM